MTPTRSGILEDLEPGVRLAVLQAAFESSLTGICLVGLDGRFLDVNAELCALLRAEKTELVGTHVAGLVVDGERPDMMRSLSHAQGYERVRARRTFVRSDGSHVPVDLQCAPVVDATGETRFLLGTVADATAQAQHEADLLRRERELAALAAGLQALLSEDDAGRLASTACRAARELTGADLAVLLEADDDHLRERGSDGRAAGSHPVLLPGGRNDRSLARLAWQTGERQQSDDLVRDGRAARHLVRETGARMALFEPLRGSRAAVLALLWRTQDPGLLAAVSPLLPVLVASARLSLQRAEELTGRAPLAPPSPEDASALLRADLSSLAASPAGRATWT